MLLGSDGNIGGHILRKSDRNGFAVIGAHEEGSPLYKLFQQNVVAYCISLLYNGHMPDENEDSRPSVVVPIRITAKQDDEVAETARQLELTKQATIRLAITRGLPVLLAQMTGCEGA